MRGTVAAKNKYAQSSSVTELPMAVLELNANTGIGYSYLGYYKTSTMTQTFAAPGGVVTGAAFSTGTLRRNLPTVDVTNESAIPVLQYVDEPDLHYEETFSVKNIIKPHRPKPGIVRMVPTQGNYMVPGYARYYPCDREALYKYWRAFNLDESNPFAYYSRDFYTNKIKIVLQNYAGLPLNYTVEVLPAGSSTWTSVWTQANSAWPLSGIFSIYYYDGAWTLTPNTDKIHNLANPTITNAVKIRGVRLKVTSMGKWTTSAHTALTADNKVPLEVIELSPRLALDITESITNFDVDLSLGDDDSALPIGTITANDCSMTVENYNGIISFDTPGSDLYGWEPKQSVIDIYFKTTLTSSTSETNRIYYGIIDDVRDSENGTSVFQILDGMSILQDCKIKSFFTQNKTLTSIILMLLDYCGISGFTAHFSDGTTDVTAPTTHPENPMVPYYYIQEETAYEALADLAESYQFSLAYDADNILHMYSKEWMIKSSGVTADAEMTYADDGAILANIKRMTKRNGKVVNDIVINYSPHYVPKQVQMSDLGMPMWEAALEPKTDPVWTGDEEILSCAPLVQTLSNTAGVSTDGSVTLDQEGAQAMDFSGFIQMNDEVIAYNAKEYMLRPSGAGAYTVKWITSEEDYAYWLNQVTTGTRMFFTGKLRIPAGGRGKFNSLVRTHEVETARDWPYASAWNSYKTCGKLTRPTRYNNNEGSPYWDYKGGKVYNVRGASANSGEPTRNGAESCIRMTNAAESEFKDYAATLSNAPSASASSAHWYLTSVPKDTNNKAVIPGRVGAGVRILGRTDGATPISALGVLGAGGIGMFMRYNSTSGWMNGWVLEIRPNVEDSGKNVKLYEVVNSVFYMRKEVTAIVPVHAPDVNTSVDVDDNVWTHLDLAYFRSYNGKPTFFAYVNGRAVMSYQPTTTVTEGAWYGTFVRGDSYMDVDYTWWMDSADPNSIQGYNAATDVDPDEYTLNDMIDGAGGPPVWWEVTSRGLYEKNRSASPYFGLNEFGSLAHAVEVKEIEFDSVPVINARPALSWGAEYKVPTYYFDGFGGRMIIVNARRRAVKIAGETAPLTIIGYKVERTQEKYDLEAHLRAGEEGYSAVEAKVNASRTVHGYSPIEISTDLIQSRAMAKNMLNWIVDACTLDCEIVDAEVFGNPLLEAGDKVNIVYSELGYSLTNLFLVTGVSHSWDDGLTTTLTLRRIK